MDEHGGIYPPSFPACILCTPSVCSRKRCAAQSPCRTVLGGTKNCVIFTTQKAAESTLANKIALSTQIRVARLSSEVKVIDFYATIRRQRCCNVVRDGTKFLTTMQANRATGSLLQPTSLTRRHLFLIAS